MKSKTIFSFFLIVILLAFSGCKKDHNFNYKQIRLVHLKTVYTSKEIFDIPDSFSFKNKIFALSKGLWEINLETSSERLLFKDGIGPNDLYKPRKIKISGNKALINSYHQLKNLPFFLIDASQEPKLKRLDFGIKAFSFDDFEIIEPDQIVMANAYWTDGLLKVFDFKKKELQKKVLKPTLHPIMNKFNINNVSLCHAGNKLYIVESINPTVRVVSLPDFRQVNEIPLSPPFYIPCPSEYNLTKFNESGHKGWMASWTTIVDMMIEGEWLLLKYKWGYGQDYGYELINLTNNNKRFFIQRSPNNIFHFTPKECFIEFDILEELEEEVEWKKCRIDIQ